jgi:hypothetical protein
MAKTNKRKTLKTANTPKTPPINRYWTGSPVPATKLYRKQMEGFSAKQHNKCNAIAWMLVNEVTQTTTYCNTYSEDCQPKASWNPEHYTHPIKDKVLAKKLEIYEEVEDREAWPSFVTFASKRKSK